MRTTWKQRLAGSRRVWLAVYLAVVLTPLMVLLVAPTPAKAGFWWDTGIGLGFAGLVMMGLQFLLTARFRMATAPFGLDLIYYFHRYLAYVLLVVVLAHPVVLIAVDPSLRWELAPWRGPWQITAGVASAVLLVVLMATTVGRTRLQIPYDVWRIAHLLLAIGAVLLALVHLFGIGYYSQTALARGLWVVIGVSLLLAVLRVRVWRPWKLLRRPYRVVDVGRQPGDVWTLVVEPVGHGGFDFQPGQFAWLNVRNSPFLMREHPFSIASSPGADGQIEFAIKQRGAFTRRIGTLERGETAYVEGPYGAFSIDRHPRATGYVFVAGGIGIAPMLSMIRALADRGDRRRHVLVAANSRWDRVPFREALRELAGRIDLELVHVLEEPPADWTGERGWIDQSMLDRHLPVERAGYHYFACGPIGMIRIAEQCLRELGIPASQVHTELFDLA